MARTTNVDSSSSASGADANASNQEDNSNTPLWKYVTKVPKSRERGGNVEFVCDYCKLAFKGSYSRVRAHLLKISGHGIRKCIKVTPQHLAELQKLEDAAQLKSQQNTVLLPPSSQSQTQILSSKKRKSPLEKSFNMSARENLDSAIARMFYSGGLPFHFARNPYYINAITYAADNALSGYVPPRYNALRTTLLQKEKANIEELLQPIKGMWREKGVSIVCDGWTDAQRRPLINFMAASEGGAVFLKAVNCEKQYKDKYFVASLIKEAISEVGAHNVVQIITDNAPVGKAAGSLVETQYRHIFWTPCVVHTLNLALKNICAAKNTEKNECYEKLSWITKYGDDAIFIKNFIMNHSMRLAIFNTFVPLKLLAVAETRFASTIIMLRRLKLIKRGMQNMVISEEWSSYREDDVVKATKVKDLILDDIWWDNVDNILSFTAPIYEMIRIMDTDKPTLHSVYEMWDEMIEKVRAIIYKHEAKRAGEESEFFDAVFKILIERWTKSYTPLHCMAHSLNPRFYSTEWLNEVEGRVAPHRDDEISKQRNACITRYFASNDDRNKANQEFARFSGASDVFGEFDSLQDRFNLEPKQWWLVHGSSAPLLQAFALKLLGQPSSSSCCERNWSTYSFIHSIRRNKMTPQYMEGENKNWDIGGDAFDSFEGAGVLEVANLSLDEPDMETILFTTGEEDMETALL